MLQLNFREQGQGRPLVILHGLFGTLDNWQTLARQWAEHFRVILVDLRNHGRSPHAPEHTYSLMAEDVRGLFDQLIVVDIAPRYSNMEHQDEIIEGLNAVDFSAVQDRQQADAALARHIRSVGVRQFLLKNLYRRDDNSFAWRINLPVLTAGLAAIGEEITAAQPFLKPALFIRGGKSDYVNAEDKRHGIPALFPNSQVETIIDAGHWVHAEKPQEVFELVTAFVNQ